MNKTAKKTEKKTTQNLLNADGFLMKITGYQKRINEGVRAAPGATVTVC